jgi:hypothetical protein
VLGRTKQCGERSGSLGIATASPPPAQPHSDATSILVNDLDGFFQGSLHHDKGRAPRLILSGLELADGDDAHLRLVGQLASIFPRARSSEVFRVL